MKIETMTADAYRSLLALQDQQEGRKKGAKKRHLEHEVQRNCVNWFRAEFPDHALMLFAVPNGGGRSRTEGAILKAEGVTAGVSDLILLEARGGYGALCIEVKIRSKKSGQSDKQREWQAAAEAAGNLYVVARSLLAFQKAVYEYMALPRTNGRVYVYGRDLGPVMEIKAEQSGGWRSALRPPERKGRYRVKCMHDSYTANWNGHDWIDVTGWRLCGVVEWREMEEGSDEKH